MLRSRLARAEEALGKATENMVHENPDRKVQEINSGSNPMLDAVINGTPMLMACLDSDFNFIWVNRAYASADEKEPGYFPGKNHFDLYPNEENQKIFQTVVETGRSFFIQAKPFEYKDNPERGVSYWDWSLIPILDSVGTVKQLVLTLLNVTERKRTDERTRRHNLILDGIGRMFIAALASRTEEDLGRACLSVAEDVTLSKFGFISELGPDGRLHNIAISDPGWKLCAMYDKQGHRTLPGVFKLHGLYGRVLADGKPFFTNDPASHRDSVGLPAGHPSLTAFLGVPLKYEGKTIGMIAVGNRENGYSAEDLDSLASLSVAIVQAFMKKRAEVAVRESEARLRTVLQSITDGYYVLDSEWRFAAMNPVAERYFDRRTEALLGENIWKVTKKTAASVIFKQFHQSVAENRPVQFETESEIRSGIWVELHLYPRDGFLEVYFRDITERKRAELKIDRLNQELQRRISELETIFRTAPIGLCIAKDSNGADIAGNPENERMLGVAAGGQLSKRAERPAEYVVLQDGRELSVDELPMQRAARGEVVTGQIVDIHRKDGKTLKLLSNAAPLYDEQGRPRGAVGAFLDITDLKQAEEALRQSEHQYRTLFESMNEVFQVLEVIRDGEGKAIDCRYREVNPAFEKLTGLTRDQILNRCASDFFKVVDENWLEFVSKVALSRQPFQREDYSPGFDRYFMIRAFSPGSDLCAMLISDITERKRAELALQRAHEELEARVEERTNDLAKTVAALQGEITARKKVEEELSRLGTAVEAAADALVVTDASRGIIQYVNPAFERITGYSRHEVLGRDLHILDSGRHDQAFYRELRETLRKEGFWSGRLIQKKKDGTLYEEECTYSSVRNSSGEIINYISIKRDVTERSRLESVAQAVDSMNNIGYIFAGVSHELGNPVNSMRMTLDTMKKKIDELTGERLLRFVNNLTSQVQNIEYLLKTIKNFNMYESLEPKQVELTFFVESFLSMVREDFESRGITIDCSVQPRARTVYADPRALQQVLLNIFTNSADAVEGRNSPSIGLRVSEKAGTVLWKIEDNGVGIEESKLKDLFKPFYTTKRHGTGLGLVIIKKMLSKMNGTVDITSRPNVGTVVEISLPSRSIGTA